MQARPDNRGVYVMQARPGWFAAARRSHGLCPQPVDGPAAPVLASVAVYQGIHARPCYGGRPRVFGPYVPGSAGNAHICGGRGGQHCAHSRVQQRLRPGDTPGAGRGEHCRERHRPSHHPTIPSAGLPRCLDDGHHDTG